MPEVSRFYGIVVKIFYNDHLPPHFHAEYGSSQVVININTLAVLAGRLPPRAMGLAMEWASLHQEELINVWAQARNFQPLDRIEPLS